MTIDMDYLRRQLKQIREEELTDFRRENHQGSFYWISNMVNRMEKLLYPGLTGYEWEERYKKFDI